MPSVFPYAVAALCIFFVSSAETFNQGTDAKQKLLDSTPFVIGGDAVESFERPYTTSLTLKNEKRVLKYCGGARLDKQWFLTAAECLDPTKYDQAKFTYPHGNKLIQIEYLFRNLDVKIHPEYDPASKANNIGLVKCRYCPYIIPIPPPTTPQLIINLPTKSEQSATFTGEAAILSSWSGITDTGSSGTPLEIVTARTTVLSQLWCKVLHLFAWVQDYHICASGWGGIGLSQEDVGVPLVIRKRRGGSSYIKLIGIAAYAGPWASAFRRPMLFTRVSMYSQWISSIIKYPLEDTHISSGLL